MLSSRLPETITDLGLALSLGEVVLVRDESLQAVSAASATSPIKRRRMIELRKKEFGHCRWGFQSAVQISGNNPSRRRWSSVYQQIAEEAQLAAATGDGAE
jgi:hypothetical protein